jgi:hypothetical protein
MNDFFNYFFIILFGIIIYCFLIRFVFSIKTIVVNLKKQTRYLEFLCKEKGMTENEISKIKYEAEV